MPLQKVSDLEKTVPAVSGVFCDVCSGKRRITRQKNCGRLLFVFFLRLRKNERMCCNVEKAIVAEGKRWVAVLIENSLAPVFTDGPPRSSVSGKTKVCYCNRGE